MSEPPLPDTPMDLTGSRILIVDDVPANLEVLSHTLEAAGYKTSLVPSGEIALQVVGRTTPDLILLDVMMPGLDGFETCRRLKANEATRPIPVIFLTARDEPDAVVQGFQTGGVDYIHKPFHTEEVLTRIQTHLHLTRLLQTVIRQNQALQQEIAARQALTLERNQLAGHLTFMSDREEARWGLQGFIGQSATIRRILDEVRLLWQAKSTSVLILGESGTGKELVARAIHYGGPNASGPFVPVNCSAIPSDLAESLFFGHVRGAFTGANRDRIGYFALAHGGTLFLDEIGDLSLESQAILLRVLEDGQIRPVGAQTSRPADVRVVAATNQDLHTRIASGTFREDLYYRLARFTVVTPPLRERKEDIPVLARHFIRLFADEMTVPTPTLTPEALEQLLSYHFPGNVRELKNMMERAVLECGGAPIVARHLHFSASISPAQPARQNSQPEAASLQNGTARLPMNLADAEALVIEQALAYTRGHISDAAKLLGINRSKLYRKLDQIGYRSPRRKRP